MSGINVPMNLLRLRRRSVRPGRSNLGVTGWICVGILVFVVFLAVFGDLLTSVDPNQVQLSQAYGAPNGAHLLGQDANGRDLLARLIVGARTAFFGPLLVVLIATTVATVLALSAVWIGGGFDVVVARVVDALFAFPGLLLAILATALFGVGLRAAVIALAIAYTPYLTRIIRSAALQERSLPYVDALRIQGLGAVTICRRHILPNIVTIIIANATLAFGLALIDLAALSFIGLGVQPPASDWGSMVAGGVSGVLQRYPQESLYASLLIVATVASANLLGDRFAARAEEQS